MKPEQHQNCADELGKKFHGFHESLAGVIKQLLKNPASKEKVLIWMRQAVALNLEKHKFRSQTPMATEGFILNYIDLLLQLCKPFTNNFQKYGTFM